MSLNLNKDRYSFIEITKLLFSIWILNGHGLFYEIINCEGQTYCIAVAYFFIVSGLFILKGIDKEQHQNPFKFAFLKIWKIDGVPIIIFTVINITAFFINKNYSDLSRITHFLWYIDALFIMFVIFFFLRKTIKNEKIFIVITSFLSFLFFII